MSGDQMPSLLGRKRRQMPGVCPGGMLKLRVDWYFTSCWSYFRLKDLHEFIFAGGTIGNKFVSKFKLSLWEKMLLSIKTAHFNFTLIRLNNISSPQFIRLNRTKCRLSKVILRIPCGSSRDKESHFSVGVQRGHFFVFVEWSFIKTWRCYWSRAYHDSRDVGDTTPTHYHLFKAQALGRFYRAPKSSQVTSLAGNTS